MTQPLAETEGLLALCLGQIRELQQALPHMGPATNLDRIVDSIVRGLASDAIPRLVAEESELEQRFPTSVRSGNATAESVSARVRRATEELSMVSSHLTRTRPPRAETAILGRVLADLEHALADRQADAALLQELKASLSASAIEELNSHILERAAEIRKAILFVAAPVVPATAAVVLRSNPGLLQPRLLGVDDL